jgi:hypothetical protein
MSAFEGKADMGWCTASVGNDRVGLADQVAKEGGASKSRTVAL